MTSSTIVPDITDFHDLPDNVNARATYVIDILVKSRALYSYSISYLPTIYRNRTRRTTRTSRTLCAIRSGLSSHGSETKRTRWISTWRNSSQYLSSHLPPAFWALRSLWRRSSTHCKNVREGGLHRNVMSPVSNVII